MKKNRSTLAIVFIFQFLLFTLQFETLSAQEAKSQTATQDDKANSSSDNYKLTVDKIDPSRFYSVATVQVLNKITGKSSLFNAKIGDEVRFGKLIMTAKKCWKASLDQRPESKILLEVFEEEENSDSKKRIFYGWMFSSSPSISGIEHPIYDIVAISCKNK